MNNKHNKKLTVISKMLSKNMTKEEKHLWYDCLKKLPITIKRQKVIGEYVVDFYCAKANLVIEIDGSQHYETKGEIKDKERDRYLKEMGLTVKRFSNYEVNSQFRSVCDEIYNLIFGNE